MIYLLHAYSAKNAGDGLLVQLSIKLIRKRFPGDLINVVCIDVDSFDKYEFENVRFLSLWDFVIQGGLIFVKNVQAVFAVGGGYLRASNFNEGFKCILSHGLQIVLSKSRHVKHYEYLPQSIGPFNGLIGRVLKSLVLSINGVIYVRDDISLNELSLDNVIRTPDLVAQEIINKFENSSTFKYYPRKIDKIVFVFRDLKGRRYIDEYIEKLKQLYSRYPEAIFALQSSGRGNSDEIFYKNVFGLNSLLSLKDVLSSAYCLVVSVRLHGSLESILYGHPSIHISYERKGVAAYSDLGINDFVFKSNDFDVEEIAERIDSVISDDSIFWNKFKKVA